MLCFARSAAAGVLLALGCDAAELLRGGDGSHRTFPGEWNTRRTEAICPGADDLIYALVAPGPRLVRFDPGSQRMALLAHAREAAGAGSAADASTALVRGPGDSLWFGLRTNPTSGVLCAYSPAEGRLSAVGLPAGSGYPASLVPLGEGRELCVATLPDGLLVLHSGREGGGRVAGRIPGYAGGPLAVLPDGRVAVLTAGLSVRVLTPGLAAAGAAGQVCRPEAAAALDAGDSPSWMFALPGGDGVTGIAGSNGVPFVCRFAEPGAAVRCAAPVAGRAGVPAGARLETAGGLGADGSFSAILSADGVSHLVTVAPDGTARYGGALAMGAKALPGRETPAVCADRSGARLWVGTAAQWGAGLYVSPSLGGEPWSNSERSYSCRRAAEGAIVIDGAPDEAAWARAEAAEGFVTAGRAPVRARWQTTSRLLWTPACLYVSHACTVDAVRAGLTGRDVPVWEDEAAELILSPGGAEAPYYEIDITPLGAVFDSRILDYSYPLLSVHWQEWGLGWNPPIEHAVRVQKDAAGRVTGWSAELAIPFAAFDGRAAPLPGSRWTFNLFRAARLEGKDTEWSAWTSTHADFHRPFDFPALVFED